MRCVWTNLYNIECMQVKCDVQVILQVSEWVPVHHDDGYDMHKERHYAQGETQPEMQSM